jgi:hypothetical protein
MWKNVEGSGHVMFLLAEEEKEKPVEITGILAGT